MKGRNKRKISVYVLIIIGFLIMEFPGVLIFGGRIRPYIFHMPFIFGFALCFWIYMCIVMIYAYVTGWGEKKAKK